MFSHVDPVLNMWTGECLVSQCTVMPDVSWYSIVQWVAYFDTPKNSKAPAKQGRRRLSASTLRCKQEEYALSDFLGP